MIELRNVRKVYHGAHGSVEVLRGLDLRIQRGEKIGVLGRNGAGKSTLIRLIGGVERPTSGAVNRTMSVSWPLAFSGAFQNSLTGRDNLRFICRVHGVDANQKMAYVEEFSELGRYMHEPLRTYSSGMRARLAFAISMAIEFDCFLIDEVMAVGDAKFQRRCEEELFGKRNERAMMIVSHHADSIIQHCSSAYVLHEGQAHYFEEPAKAYEYYAAQYS